MARKMEKCFKHKTLLAIPQDYKRFNDLWTPEAAQLADDLGIQVDIIQNTPESDEEWQAVLAGYRSIITSWCTPELDQKLLRKADQLELITHAAGSVADLAGKLPHNINVCSANAIMAESVAEWCVAMTWLGLNNFLKYANVGGKRPMNWQKESIDFRNIRDSVIGVWGYGDICRSYLQLLRPFMPEKIMIASDHLSGETNEWTLASLEKIFSSCDVIICLAALTPKNRRRIDRKLLSLIKPGAALLNPGRGLLINEEDLLAEFSRNGFCYIADAFHLEPLPDGHPLQQLPNVILTPHCAGQNTHRYVPAMLEEIDRYFRGQPLLHQLSRQRLENMTSNKLNYG